MREREKSVVREFESLIRAKGTKEEELHEAIVRNPVVLYQFGGPLLISKPRIDTDFVADFAVRTVGNGEYWRFIEIERANHRLFTRAGLPSAALAQSLKQIRDWDSSLSSYLGRFGGNSFAYCVVIGRRQDLSPLEKRRLAALNASMIRSRVMTWDSLIDPLKNGLARLDPQGPTTISDAEFRRQYP